MANADTSPASPSPCDPFWGVSIGNLAIALDSSPSSIKRAVAAAQVPEAEGRTAGGHRRWSVAAAAAIVRAAGREVPAEWNAGQPPAAAGASK